MVFHEAAVECAMSASGAHLAVAMNKEELLTFRDTTPNIHLWLGKLYRILLRQLNNLFLCFNMVQ